MIMGLLLWWFVIIIGDRYRLCVFVGLIKNSYIFMLIGEGKKVC